MQIFWFEIQLSDEQEKKIEDKLKKHGIKAIVISGVKKPDVISVETKRK